MIFATLRFITIIFFRFISLFIFFFSQKRKPITFDNINLCFPANNDYEQKRNYKIAKKSFLYLGHAVADFLLLRFYTKKNIDKYIRGKNLDYLITEKNKGNGVILTTAHFGSFELAAHYLALKGFGGLILYTPIKKPLWLEKFVRSNRERSGNILISKYSSLLRLYRHLKKGGIIIALIDQHCSPAEGRRIPFFNHKVWTHTMVIKLSLKTGAPILPGFIYIKNLFKYELEAFEPLYPHKYLKYQDSEYEMATSSNKVLEMAINKSLYQWLWQHRRFKHLESDK